MLPRILSDSQVCVRYFCTDFDLETMYIFFYTISAAKWNNRFNTVGILQSYCAKTNWNVNSCREMKTEVNLPTLNTVFLFAEIKCFSLTVQEIYLMEKGDHGSVGRAVVVVRLPVPPIPGRQSVHKNFPKGANKVSIIYNSELVVFSWICCLLSDCVTK